MNTVDPLGGSWAVEHATNRIEREATATAGADRCDGRHAGGDRERLIQREIQESAYRAQREIDAKAAIVVGVNGFTSDAPSAIEVLSIDPDVERRQIERVCAGARRAAIGPRGARPSIAVATAAREGSTTSCRRSSRRSRRRATVGEIADTLREVFGEHKEIDV